MVFRKLTPADLPAMQAHFARLTLEDRVARFHAFVSLESVAGHVHRTDWLRGIMLGAFIDDGLRGLGELRLEEPWSRRAELAFSVERGYQGRRLGHELARRAMVVARNRGIIELVLICLPTNIRMQRIARRLGFAMRHDDGEVMAEIAVPPPNPLTVVQEINDDWAGLFGHSAPREGVGAPG